MSSQTSQNDNTYLNVPRSNEPHGISCTIVTPSPPGSPNFAASFSGAQNPSLASAANRLQSNGKSNGKK